MWALKHATVNSAIVWVRHTSNGVLTVQANGQTFTGDTISTTVDDGTGICTVTGLSANSQYPFTAYVGTELVATGTLKTMPSGGRFAIAGSSCFGYWRDAPVLEALLDHYGDRLALFVDQGDNPYQSEPTHWRIALDGNYEGGIATVNGESIQSCEYSLQLRGGMTAGDESYVKENHYAHYRAYWKMPSVQRMQHSVPYYQSDDDDHGWIGNDWRGGASADWDGGANTALIRASANFWARLAYSLRDAAGYAIDQTTYDWCVTQSDFDFMNLWGNEVQAAYQKGLPASAGAGFAQYFTMDIGDATLIFLDTIRERQVQGASNLLLSAAQEAFLYASLKNSTNPWKLIMAGKAFRGCSDDFREYTDQQARIGTYISNSINAGNPDAWAVPGGVVWFTGDIHHPSVVQNEFAVVIGNPAGSTLKTDVLNGYAPAAIPTHTPVYKSMGYTTYGITQAEANRRSYTAAWFIEVNGADSLEFGIMDECGNKRYSATLMPGENIPVSHNKLS